MIVLGIETSCDETAAAVVENGVKIISNVVASSQEMHAKTGGIIPEEAARQQIKSILPVIDEALKETPVDKIDAIAVTIGPGLVGSLLVGVETAKTLSFLWNKPVITVNHLIAHIYANFLNSGQENNIEFPILALIVSGGHTDLVYMTSHSHMEWIGGTRDDAAGEAFDKTARLLGLPYPGGPAISKSAKEYRDTNPEERFTLLPRPMIDEKGFDMSFSGLKTAVNRLIQKNENLSVPKIATETEEAITDVLVNKTLAAASTYQPKTILIGGGVAANSRLREKFKQVDDYKIFFPEPKYCTDNAAAIAGSAFFHQNKMDWKAINVRPELTVANLI